MRHYEILLLFNPDQHNQIPNMLDRYVATVTKNGGKVHRQEDWGKVQLAYQIKKLYKAHYILLNIECPVSVIQELSNNFKFNDAVLRSLIIKCEAAITEQSIFLKNRENEKNNKDGTYHNQATNSNDAIESIVKIEDELEDVSPNNETDQI